MAVHQHATALSTPSAINDATAWRVVAPPLLFISPHEDGRLAATPRPLLLAEDAARHSSIIASQPRAINTHVLPRRAFDGTAWTAFIYALTQDMIAQGPHFCRACPVPHALKWLTDMVGCGSPGSRSTYLAARISVPCCSDVTGQGRDAAWVGARRCLAPYTTGWDVNHQTSLSPAGRRSATRRLCGHAAYDCYSRMLPSYLGDQTIGCWFRRLWRVRTTAPFKTCQRLCLAHAAGCCGAALSHFCPPRNT